MYASHAVGVLSALILLSGRWGFDRLQDEAEGGISLLQPRCWLVAALVVLVLLQFTRSQAIRRLRLEWSDFWLLTLFAYLLTTLAWAPDHELTPVKGGEIALEGCTLLMLAVSRTLFDRHRLETGFWLTLLGIGLALATVTILVSTTGRAIAPGGGPITFGRNMGLMAIAAWRLAERRSNLHRLAASQVFVLAMLMVVMSGSRGALLSYGTAGTTLILLHRMSWLNKAAAVFGIAILGAIAMQYTEIGKNASQVFEQRIVETTLEKQYVSGRDDLWLQAHEMAQERPFFGWGLNGFRANSWNYPHNVFLEILVEGGLLGLALLLLTLTSWSFRVWRFRHILHASNVAALVLSTTSAQTSGDLYDSRCLFIMLLMATPSAVCSYQFACDRSSALNQQLPRKRPTFGTGQSYLGQLPM